MDLRNINFEKMATESERKFLLKGEFKKYAIKSENIIQAYISTTPGRTVRVRIKGEKAFLTVKGIQLKGTISRKEWEVEIPVNDAREMLDICLPGIIEKIRYYVPVGKHMYEVDEFHGKNEGLLIAEIELGSENEVFQKPEWLGKEVTGRPEYFNSNLIK
jgi:adenylate cyclase